MKKKMYVKPEINMIALRTEERLAVCDSWYISKWKTPGCTTNQYQVTAPAICFAVDETTGS